MFIRLNTYIHLLLPVTVTLCLDSPCQSYTVWLLLKSYLYVKVYMVQKAKLTCHLPVEMA